MKMPSWRWVFPAVFGLIGILFIEFSWDFSLGGEAEKSDFGWEGRAAVSAVEGERVAMKGEEEAGRRRGLPGERVPLSPETFLSLSEVYGKIPGNVVEN